MKTSKIALLVVLALMLVSVTALVYYVDNYIPTDWLATDVEPISPHYITHYGSGRETKIFLVNSAARYSFWRENDTTISYWGEGGPGNPPIVNYSDPLFIINVTIRSDYTFEDNDEPDAKTVGPVANNVSYIVLKTTLFYENGTIIPAISANIPTSGMIGYRFSLRIGETKSIELILATENRNIDHYIIEATYLYGWPR